MSLFVLFLGDDRIIFGKEGGRGYPRRLSGEASHIKWIPLKIKLTFDVVACFFSHGRTGQRKNRQR